MRGVTRPPPPKPTHPSRVRIYDRDERTVGWLADPPQNPGWQIVDQQADAGVFPWWRGAELAWSFRRDRAWSGLHADAEPA